MGANSPASHRQLHRTMTKYLLLALFLGVAMASEYDDSALMDQGEGRFLYLNSSPAATSYSRYGQDYNQYYQGYQGQARSSSQGWGFDAMNVLQWISMLQEVYEKFDYNDVECQKRLICEVLKEEEYFGDVSRNLKSGFELAKYLEVMNLPDEFRELLDEYMDASERSLGQKQCEEFFQCPYSLKDAVKRNFSGNSL